MEAIGEHTHIEYGTVSQMIVEEFAKHVVIKKDAFVGVLKNEATTDSANSIEVQGVVQIADSSVNMTVTGYVQNTGAVTVVRNENNDITITVPTPENLHPGQGTPANVDTLIASVSELERFRDNVNAGRNYSGLTVKLTADIDLTGRIWTPIGVDSAGSFFGTFDGQGHTIKSLSSAGYVIPEGSQFVSLTNHTVGGVYGLFGCLINRTGSEKTTTIKNIKFENINIDFGSQGTGAVVGLIASTAELANGTKIISNEVLNVNISGITVGTGTDNSSIKATKKVGGIVGQGDYWSDSTKCTNLKIDHCTNNANIEASERAGGIVGGSSSVYNTIEITNSTNNSTITSEKAKSIGQIIGIPLKTGLVLSGNQANGTATNATNRFVNVTITPVIDDTNQPGVPSWQYDYTQGNVTISVLDCNKSVAGIGDKENDKDGIYAADIVKINDVVKYNVEPDKAETGDHTFKEGNITVKINITITGTGDSAKTTITSIVATIDGEEVIIK